MLTPSSLLLLSSAIILAGGHVRASAGALAVHTALIPCACVSVCLSGHKLLSHHATNRDQVCFCRQVSTRWVDNCHGFFSLLCLGRAATVQTYHPTKKLSIFQFPFASIRRAPSEACSGLGKRRIDRSTSKRSSKKLQRAAITAFFLDRSLVVVHCDRSWPVDDCHESENNACA